jgi:hypothetical protein
MSDDDEFNNMDLTIPMWGRFILVLIVGILIGSIATTTIFHNREYRNPEEGAVYIEELIFEGKHIEDIQHGTAQYLLNSELTTIKEIKRYWSNYPVIAHNLLVLQVNKLCYDSKWKEN